MLDSQSVSLLTEAEQALGAVLPPACDGPPRAAGAFPLEDFGHRAPPAPAHRPDAGAERLDLRIELGRTRMGRGEVRRLRSGSVIPLDKLAGEPVDLHVGGRRIARGELLVLDGKIAVRVVELSGY